MRRCCGPGGGCCAHAQSVDTPTARMTTASSASVVAGTTTMTSTSFVHRDRGKENKKSHDHGDDDTTNNRLHDPSWIEEKYIDNCHCTSCRLNRHTHLRNAFLARQVNPLRDDTCFTICSDCSRLYGDCERDDREFCEVGDNGRRRLLSVDNEGNYECDLRPIHRLEQVKTSARLPRRQRVNRTGICQFCCESGTNDRVSTQEWTTPAREYVDLIVRGQHHVDDDRPTNATNNRHPTSTNFWSATSVKRRRIPPYLATLLIISYTLFGIAGNYIFLTTFHHETNLHLSIWAVTSNRL